MFGRWKEKRKQEDLKWLKHLELFDSFRYGNKAQITAPGFYHEQRCLIIGINERPHRAHLKQGRFDVELLDSKKVILVSVKDLLRIA